MVTYRKATPLDYKNIAELHVKNWQQHYRGNFSDHFLDVEASLEREGVWKDRLNNPSANQLIFVGELDNEICGFACAYLDDDPLYGTLLDNLHVLGTAKGMGIGKHLMGLVAQEANKKDPNAKMYLWVLQDNLDAIGFYERLGGFNVETVIGNDIGDKEVLKCRMVWNSLKGMVKLVV